MIKQRLPAYEIRVKGHLELSWVDELIDKRFDKVEVRHEAQGETVFFCREFDQAALNTLLNSFYALNIQLISVVPR